MPRMKATLSRSVLMMVVLASAAVLAQQPARQAQTPSNPKLPPLFFTETWKQTGLERDVDKDVLSNANLELKLYGPTSKQIQIAPTTPNTRQDPPNLWTGICNGPIAAALRDKNNYVDLTGRAKIRWQTRSAGFHVVRPVLKLADGTWLVGDHADGDGSSENFIETEFSISSVRWLKLDIATVTTVHAERQKAPELGRWVEHPDLSKVDEVGFADLMPGSGHGWGGFVNVGRIDVYGVPVKR
jgi:hypothetical protein